MKTLKRMGVWEIVTAGKKSLVLHPGHETVMSVAAAIAVFAGASLQWSRNSGLEDFVML